MNPQLTDYESQSLQKLGESIQYGKWSNKGMVQLLELVGDFLNIKTIPDYCKENKISYNGAKKHRNVVKMFNVKFVLDNQ